MIQPISWRPRPTTRSPPQRLQRLSPLAFLSSAWSGCRCASRTRPGSQRRTLCRGALPRRPARPRPTHPTPRRPKPTAQHPPPAGHGSGHSLPLLQTVPQTTRLLPRPKGREGGKAQPRPTRRMPRRRIPMVQSTPSRSRNRRRARNGRKRRLSWVLVKSQSARTCRSPWTRGALT